MRRVFTKFIPENVPENKWPLCSTSNSKNFLNTFCKHKKMSGMPQYHEYDVSHLM